MANTFKKLQVVELSSDFEKAVRIVEEQIPKPSSGHVLVRNLYAGVNATDVNVAAGRYFGHSQPPFDIGFESVGVVKDVGGSSNFKKGQAVLYNGLKGYSQYVLAAEEELTVIKAAKPEYLAMGIVAVTSAIGLQEIGRIEKGEKVLITAAAGGTGQIAVQWAKMNGCHVIGTCSSPEKEEYLKSIGCDFVINYKKDNMDEVLSRQYPHGIDVIWETIGGDTTSLLFKHLARKGRMILLGSIIGYTSVGFTQLNIPNLTTELVLGSKQILGYLVLNHVEKMPEYLKQLITKYESGVIKARVDNGDGSSDGPFKGIESVAKAVNYLHSGKSYGKVVVEL